MEMAQALHDEYDDQLAIPTWDAEAKQRFSHQSSFIRDDTYAKARERCLSKRSNVVVCTTKTGQVIYGGGMSSDPPPTAVGCLNGRRPFLHIAEATRSYGP